MRRVLRRVAQRLAQWVDARDCAAGIGLVSLTVGVWLSASALIVFGAALFYLGVWHPLVCVAVLDRKRGD